MTSRLRSHHYLCLLLLLVICEKPASGIYTYYFGILPNHNCDKVTLTIVTERRGTARLTVPFLNVDRTVTLQTRFNQMDIGCGLTRTGTFVQTRGIYLSTASKITLYATNFQIYTADTFLVSPLRGASNNFKIVSHEGSYSRDSYFMVIGANDNTKVSIRDSGRKHLMNPIISAIEIIQISSAADLTLSRVSSSKPVTVISGNKCAMVPFGICCCDAIFSQMIPLEAWSTTYIIPPIPPKKAFLVKVIKGEAHVWFRFCARDKWNYICETGQSLSQLFGTEPVVVTADYPISVVQFGIGRRYRLGGSDPFMSVIQGTTNYLNKYVFAVPVVYSDMNNYVAATVPRSHRDGLRLDGYRLRIEYTYSVPAPLDKYTVVIAKVNRGYHVMEHTNPRVLYGLQVYGFGDYLGYSYPAGFRMDLNDCESNPCKNGATCINNFDDYTCKCAGGWQGIRCNKDINECDSNPCQNGATCHNKQNRYTCSCAKGWQGYNCDQDINECISNPCKNGATCHNKHNHYTCTCARGWKGYNCDQDINECNSNPCVNGGTCHNKQNHYTCTCAGGWQGYNCGQDINECDSNPCVNGATCHNKRNHYTCTCAGGWQGYNCDQDINECNSNPCQNGATCHNNQNHYTCTCAGGWQGYNCDQDINECDSNPCLNGATCHNNQNHYKCSCAGGWQGYNCDQDINECDSNPCQNGATCHNNQNHYTCTCAGGWQGYNCDQDINECDSNPCQNGATCHNNQNNYTCTCAGGWVGYNCDVDVDECASNPCFNGATCNNLENLYTCTCAEGWREYNCDKPDVTFYCYPNNTIYVYYLTPGAYSYAMQNTSTTGTDVQCTIISIDPRTVKMTGCSKDLPILFSFGTYPNMETYQLLAGDSFTAITIKCNEIPETGNIHGVNHILAASLHFDEENVVATSYDVTSSLNTTSAGIGSKVAWTIFFPVEYILEVSSCTAYPGYNNASSLHAPLISSGGCHADRQLISDFVDNMNGSATAIIKAFMFYEEESVFLQCVVTICPDIAGQSCDTTCSRTKRAVKPTDSEKPVGQYQRKIQNILRIVELSSGTVRNVPSTTAGVSLTLILLSAVILP